MEILSKVRGFAIALLAGSMLLCSCSEMKKSKAAPPGRYKGMVLNELFDGKTLNGWRGNPEIWSVRDEAIHGITEHGGQLILTAGDYSDFRLIIKSRLLSEKNHLGVCFWGERKADWGYGDCILVIPPTGGMWDYHPGKKGPPREKLPHPDFDPHVWHESEILAHLKTGTIRMAVNGVEVTRYTDEDATRLRRGPIGLQIHAGASEVEYKEIKIEVDPKEDRLITLKPVKPGTP
jgi:3-keto-disaccharide hydrolase